MSAEEKSKLIKNERSLVELIEDIRSGRIQKENLSTEMLSELKLLLNL